MSPNNYSVSFNPATGEEICKSALHTPEDVQNAVKAAKIAQRAWAETPLVKRISCLTKVRRYIVSNADQLADVIASDNGKTRVDALATEILPAAMSLSYYCNHAEQFLKPRTLTPGNIALSFKTSKVVRAPYGVVGIISPWNYPYAIPFSEIVMGLLAGNAVILKTASETQLVGLALKQSIEAAGLPPDIFKYVNLPGRIAGDAFLEAGVDKIFFTGSVAVGKYLMEKAAKTLTPLCLELGGNDPMIVCEDADLERAAAGAVWAGFQNAGQSCGGVERIYIHEKVYEPFMKILKEKTETLRVGYDAEYNVDIGCMTTERQMSTVREHIEDALSKGAKIYAQSQVPADKKLKNFLPAMVLSDCTHEMLTMKDETFGPVVGVMKYSNDEEAVRLANDSYLGLTASIWSKNSRRAKRLALRMQAGVVSINDHLMSHGLAETSWGGFKQSGIGRTHGEIGFSEFTQPQMIVGDLLSFAKKQMWWHPFDKSIYLGLKGLLNFLYGLSLGARLTGMIRLLKILPRMFRK